MPFPYYKRLSRRDKAIYRQSAAIPRVELPEPARLRPLASRVEVALEADDREAVERACQRLVAAVTKTLGCEPVLVHVLAVRPRNAAYELHGLYVREPGVPAVIRVWMRTARRSDVVKYRTFLRTLLHEVCHHLDYVHFELADSFHTEGFFQRESSLMRQLAPKGARGRGTKKPRAAPEPEPEPSYDPQYALAVIAALEQKVAAERARAEPAPVAEPAPRKKRERPAPDRQMDLPFG